VPAAQLSSRDDAAALRGGLRPLLEPRSLAIVGASDRQGAQWALVENAKRGGVEVWPVNPSRAEVLGLRCHPSVAALPGAPDVVLLAVAPEASLTAEAALIRFLWKAAPLLNLCHDVGYGGLERTLEEAARWSGREADVDLPVEPETGAAVLAVSPDQVERLGSKGYVQIGQVR